MNDFSKRAKHILETAAQAEGRRLKSESIGPEHIFLAILADDGSSAAQVLERLGVNATVRRNRGTDIDAACGQLAAGQPVEIRPVRSRGDRPV